MASIPTIFHGTEWCGSESSTGTKQVVQSITAFAATTIEPSPQEDQDRRRLLARLPILIWLSVNLRRGTRARGRWRASTTDDTTTKSLAPLGPARIDTAREGTMATPREARLRSQSGTDMSTNPDITNCPAYVPVMVELWPEARRAMAQRKEARSPNVFESKFPADSSPTAKHSAPLAELSHLSMPPSHTISKLCCPLLSQKLGAKLEAATKSTLVLTKKLTMRAIDVSMVV
mmetsp:Transcript_72586/g.151590  ORF Transcript_72586/g.151590 Transcript_72586/m.151590 type:complete len:232 (-) Transcript_72586:944-1639(-)